LAQRRYDLDLTFLMRSITVIECNHGRIKNLADKISKGQLERRHLNRRWKQSRGAIDRVIRLLQKGLSLDKSKFVISKNALIPMVYCLANHDGKELSWFSPIWRRRLFELAGKG